MADGDFERANIAHIDGLLADLPEDSISRIGLRLMREKFEAQIKVMDSSPSSADEINAYLGDVRSARDAWIEAEAESRDHFRPALRLMVLLRWPPSERAGMQARQLLIVHTWFERGWQDDLGHLLSFLFKHTWFDYSDTLEDLLMRMLCRDGRVVFRDMVRGAQLLHGCGLLGVSASAPRTLECMNPRPSDQEYVAALARSAGAFDGTVAGWWDDLEVLFGEEEDAGDVRTLRLAVLEYHARWWREDTGLYIQWED